ncbi:hypothetical protein PFISCL1PPCAC_11017, partial [Pristionchus fissidentatus]
VHASKFALSHSKNKNSWSSEVIYKLAFSLGHVNRRDFRLLERATIYNLTTDCELDEGYTPFYLYEGKLEWLQYILTGCTVEKADLAMNKET